MKTTTRIVAGTLLVGLLAVTFSLWQLLRERLLKALPPSSPNAVKGFWNPCGKR